MWRDTLVWDTKALIQKETIRAIRAARKRSAATGPSRR